MIKELRKKWLEQNINTLNELLKIVEFDQNPFNSLQKLNSVNDVIRIWHTNLMHELENIELEEEKE